MRAIRQEDKTGWEIQKGSNYLKLSTGSKTLFARHIWLSPLSLASHSCCSASDFYRLCSHCLQGIHCFKEHSFFEKWHLWQLLFLRSYIKIIAKTKQSLERAAFNFEELVPSSSLGLSCLLPLHAPPHTHLSPAPSQVPNGPCCFCPPLFGLCPAIRVGSVSLSWDVSDAQAQLGGWVGKESG